MLSTLANTLRKRVTQALPGKQPSYRIFDVQLKRRIALSPSLTRLVFSGPDVAEMTTLAPDQRVKLLFPAPDGSRPNLSNERHWKAAHSALPADQRPPMRTYTIRALRREALEVDIDFVLHGVNGPASAWATHAQVGDSLQMVAPNLAYEATPVAMNGNRHRVCATYCWSVTKPRCRQLPAFLSNWPTTSSDWRCRHSSRYRWS